MHVTITGATGLIGSRLVARLQARGDQITVISRNADHARSTLGDVEAVAWDPTTGPAPAAALEGRDAVINLAGEPVFQRWTDAAKRRIESSRISTTENLVAAIGATGDRPETLINGSASGYYGDTGAREVTEDAPHADDFLGRVAHGWEQAAHGAEAHGLRVAVIRTGLVLDADGGALPALVKPIRLGASTWLGNGRQYVPWIHLDDHVGLILAALDTPSFSGPINASAPYPTPNRELSKAVAQILRRPMLAGVPAPLLRMILGERAALVLDSCRMVPGRADELDYTFLHPELDSALQDLLGR